MSPQQQTNVSCRYFKIQALAYPESMIYLGVIIVATKSKPTASAFTFFDSLLTHHIHSVRQLSHGCVSSTCWLTLDEVDSTNTHACQTELPKVASTRGHAYSVFAHGAQHHAKRSYTNNSGDVECPSGNQYFRNAS